QRVRIGTRNIAEVQRGRHQDDVALVLDLGWIGIKRTQELEAVHFRHLDVQQNDGGRDVRQGDVARKKLQRLVGIAESKHRAADTLYRDQPFMEQQVDVVVIDQNNAKIRYRIHFGSE